MRSSNTERTGKRPMEWSGWRRTLPEVTNIDLDNVEHCHYCFETLALMEVTQGYGQSSKPDVVVAKLARRAGLPGFLVVYALVSDGIGSDREIDLFWVRPTEGGRGRKRGEWKTYEPEEFADVIIGLHTKHWKNECTAMPHWRLHRALKAAGLKP